VLLLVGVAVFLIARPEKIKKDSRGLGAPAVMETAPAPVIPAVEPAPVTKPVPSAPVEKKRVGKDTAVDGKQLEVKQPALQEKRSIIHVQRGVVKKEVGPGRVQKDEQAPVRNGDALFRDRLRASAAWLAGAYRGQYTIQLMMLSSKSAKENVKKLLVRDDYFAVIDKLHILRKKTNPPTLFVFYGTYPSMDAARQVRNTMPVFLRKHHPYALSIADALTKTED